MIYLTLIGAAVMCWVLLRILGDERQRRVQVLRVIIEEELRAAAEERDRPK